MTLVRSAVYKSSYLLTYDRRQMDGRQHIANVNVSSRSLKMSLCSLLHGYAIPALLHVYNHILTFAKLATYSASILSPNFGNFRDINHFIPARVRRYCGEVIGSDGSKTVSAKTKTKTARILARGFLEMRHFQSLVIRTGL